MSRAPAEPLLTARGVETFYGNIQALRGVDIDVNRGEIVTAPTVPASRRS